MTDHRLSTLDRFNKQRDAWARNSALRRLYAYWFTEIRMAVQPLLPGLVVELGSGSGFAKQFMPELRTSDTIKAEWHDYQIDATQRWPFADGELDGIVVFDVLHHLSPTVPLFREAVRTLRPGGRLVMMEPYVSLCSYPIYRFLHDEGMDTSVEPFAMTSEPDKDPFAGNQALPGLIFGRHADEFNQTFPVLREVQRNLYSGFSYVASGGFNRRPVLPLRMWNSLFWFDRHMPRALRPLFAFRMLLVLERTA